MSNNILFSFRRCPYAIRARMTLYISDIDYDLVEVSLKNKPQELINCSAKAQVPVIKLKDNTVIDESFDIMVWALKQHDPQNWLPKNDEQWKFCKHHLKLNDITFKNALDICKYQIRHSEQEIKQAKQDCEKILLTWDKILKTQKFLHGDHLGLVDIIIIPFVRQFSKITPDIFVDTNTPSLKKWLQHITSSELFKTVIKKNS